MEGSKGRGQIGVIGSGACSPELSAIASEVGETVAANRFFLICGGLGGIMPEPKPKPKVALTKGSPPAWPVTLIQGSLAKGPPSVAVWPKAGKPTVGIKTRELGGWVPIATGGRLP